MRSCRASPAHGVLGQAIQRGRERFEDVCRRCERRDVLASVSRSPEARLLRESPEELSSSESRGGDSERER